MSWFSKIFTSLLNKRISEWIDDNTIVNDAQYGFMAGRSTVDAIFILNAVVDKALNDKGRLYCGFIDLTKAFDSVNHCNLWTIIYKLGINGKLLKNMYSSVKTCVKERGVTILLIILSVWSV